MDFNAQELKTIITALEKHYDYAPSDLVDCFKMELEKVELYDASFDMFNDCGDACKL